MKKISDLTAKIKSSATDFKAHWHVPKEGQYVSNKEAIMLFLGGSGASGIGNILTYITFSASSFLVGAVYGISFRDIYIIGLLGIVFTFIFSPITMIISDNYGRPPKKTMNFIHIVCACAAMLGIGCLFIPPTLTEKIIPALPQILGSTLFYYIFNVYFQIFMFRVLAKRFGKFRSWVIAGSLPTVACVLLLGFLPMNEWDYGTKLWVINLIFSLYGMFYVFSTQTGNIMNLITPNSEERAKVRTWEMFIAGALGGTTMLLLPIFADLVGGLNNINTYRYIVPSGVLLFTPLILLLAFKVKERVIVEEEHKPKIDIWKGYKSILKNKYLWIINLSTILESITVGGITILNVMVVYSLRKDYLLGALTGLSDCFGTVVLPLVPKAIRKFGKKRTLVFCTLSQLLALGLQLLGVYTNSIVLLYIGIGSINIFGIFNVVARELMTPDIWDYQQYISGERMESSAGIFSVLFNPIGKVLCLTVPALYTLVGFTSDWNVLYFDDVRNNIFLYTILLMMVSKVISVIPFFFYDLSETKHKKIMEVLEERAGLKKTVEEAVPTPPAPIEAETAVSCVE